MRRAVDRQESKRGCRIEDNSSTSGRNRKREACMICFAYPRTKRPGKPGLIICSFLTYVSKPLSAVLTNRLGRTNVAFFRDFRSFILSKCGEVLRSMEMGGGRSTSALPLACHPERSESASAAEGSSAAGGKGSMDEAAFLWISRWLPPAGRSFGCARGLAALRMTGRSESAFCHPASCIPHPASRIPHPIAANTELSVRCCLVRSYPP